MKEAFLQYVWQHQLFEKSKLLTSQSEELHILSPGMLNKNSGPDFSIAKIKLGTIEWHGNIEIHYRASDWLRHKHQLNPAYNNTILHVVWHNDIPLYDLHKRQIPTLVLKGRVNENLIQRFDEIIKNANAIPCEKYFSSTNSIDWLSMLDKATANRLEHKSNYVEQLLVNNNYDWEETTYHLLFKNFGFKINAHAFETLAEKIPFKTIKKQMPDIFKIEAILFGQSGLLNQYHHDDYPAQLIKEYHFLAKKYDILENKMKPQQWKFSRTRPTNFPTIRIAQLAGILAKNQSLFSCIINTENVRDFYDIFNGTVSPYWHQHYSFDKPSEVSNNTIGKGSIDNIMMNTVVPLLVCYAKAKEQYEYFDRALHFLNSIAAEQNQITKIWTTLGAKITNAFDSQGSVELYNNYCIHKKCLECNIGNNILKKSLS